MKPYGKAQIKRFGKDTLEGYTIIQPIETSCITCHFDEVDNRAFIDIFSCKEYNNKLAVEFCKNYFKAEITQARFLNRK